jgi:hypothetical protein
MRLAKEEEVLRERLTPVCFQIFLLTERFAGSLRQSGKCLFGKSGAAGLVRCV